MPAGSERPKSCPEVLQVPKVAMLFLTQGPMPHEELWKRWLASIAGTIPTLCLGNAVCARGGLPVSSQSLPSLNICFKALELSNSEKPLCSPLSGNTDTNSQSAPQKEMVIDI